MKRIRIVAWVAVAALLAAVGLAFLLRPGLRYDAVNLPATLPLSAKIGGPFELTTHEGRRMSSAELAGKPYGRDPQDDASMRVIADHARATAFLVADGVFPDKTAREYTLRRIFRRHVVEDRRGADGLAFASAVIWLVHPLQTEVVDYVTQRTESMMGMFYLLTFYATVRAIQADRDSPRWTWGARSP